MPRSPYVHIAAGLFAAALAVPFAGCGLSTQGTAESTAVEVCQVDANCDDDNKCTIDKCGPDGVCVETSVKDGVASDQVQGDCGTNQCKGGVEVKVDDDTDAPDDGEDCTIDTCNAGVASHTSKPNGADCKKGGASGNCSAAVCKVACGSNLAGCDDKNECTTDSCDVGAGMCVYTDLNGVPTPNTPAVAGDCHVHVCIEGKDTNVVDDTDVNVTATDCDQQLCNQGTPSNPPLMQGTACKTGGGAVCDAAAGCVECNDPADCAGMDDACVVRTCTANKCGKNFTAAMTQVPGVQTTGDCKKIVCDGSGNSITITDAGDIPDDANTCTTDTCNGSTPVNTPLAVNTPCGNGLVCSGGTPLTDKCQGCNVGTQCPGVDDDCKTRTCLGGNCGVAFAASGKMTMAQTAGDCQDHVCDGSGNAHDVVDNGDVPVDNKECTSDVCTFGVPSNPSKPVDTKCSVGYCDGVTTCAQCGSTPVGECAAPPVCVNATCIGHVCGTTPVAAGIAAPAALQTTGDCKVVDCNGAGGTQIDPLPGDVPNDGNVCTADVCTGSTPSNPPTASGTACSAPGNKIVCDGAGTCVQCVGPAQCTDQGVASCGTNGTCVGNSCAKYPLGAVCLAAACAVLTETQTTASTCSGAGVCNAGTSSSCGNYACGATACKTMCGSDADCANTAYCSGTICTPKLAKGIGCSATDQCQSGFCADGVCCDSACTGTCRACTALLKGGGADGACANIGAGVVSAADCTDAGVCGNDGNCNGAGACEDYLVGTSCGSSATCSGGMQTTAQTCNGGGACTGGVMSACGNYACNAGMTACNTTCATDNDCIATAYCDKAAGGTCKPQVASLSACDDANCKVTGCKECSPGLACPVAKVCP